MKEWICEEVPAVTLDGKVVSTMIHKTQELVRCRDCKHYLQDGVWKCRYFNGCSNSGDWFCADGERGEK